MIGKIFFMHCKINPDNSLKKNVYRYYGILTKYYRLKILKNILVKQITIDEIRYNLDL